MLDGDLHTALDARYATSHGETYAGETYAAFIHPLSPLTPNQINPSFF